MKKMTISLIAVLQCGCALDESVTYLGAVSVQPNALGVVQGVPENDLSVVRDALGNGYVHGFTIGADADDFSSGNIAGAGANYAVSGILPDPQVGALPLAGTATMSGRYDLTHVDGYAQTSNPNAWTVTQAGGPLSIDVNFETGAISGESDDGEIRVRRSNQDEDGLDIAPFDNGNSATVRFRGLTADIRDFEIGAEGAVAAFNGQNNNAFLAGGFVVATD